MRCTGNEVCDKGDNHHVDQLFSREEKCDEIILRGDKMLESYFENREQCVAIGESRSEPMALQYGVLQGSVLGPVLFTVYTGTLAFLLEAHGVSYHFFADDTQLYIRVEDIDEAKHRLSSLMSDLKNLDG